MTMHIAFRVEGNSTIGLGHLMRCLALAQHGVRRNFKVSFLMTAQSRKQAKQREDWVGDIYILDENENQTETIRRFCREMHVDFIVIDGYQFSSATRASLASCLKSENVIIVAIDDNNDLGALYADCIINSNSHAQSLDYVLSEPTAHCLLGEKFRILRREFFLTQQQRENALILDKRQTLTIVLGGADTTNLSYRLADAINAVSGNIPITIITGSAFKDIHLLNQLASNDPNVTHLHNVQNVADVFLASRLVVSAGGSTQYELQALCTPALLLIVADNQQQASEQSQREGKAWAYNMQKDTDINDIVSQVLTLWDDSSQLSNMMRASGIQGTPSGADNIYNALIHLKEVSGK